MRPERGHTLTGWPTLQKTTPVAHPFGKTATITPHKRRSIYRSGPHRGQLTKSGVSGNLRSLIGERKHSQERHDSAVVAPLIRKASIAETLRMGRLEAYKRNESAIPNSQIAR
jgi:hypothetical protein